MKRADLKIGFACNNHCRFCVQGRKREALKSKTLKEAKKEIDKARIDCQEIVFTGGEPCIHPNFLELVAYAKKKRFKIIQIQSNGRMFAYRNFCEQVISAGANQFSPALHGHIPELHDFLTSAPGSFNQTVQGIKNLKSLGQQVITNTVITKSNYRHLPEIASLLVNLGVDQFQFAFVHALGNAKDNFESIVPRMEIAEPFVKRGLDIGIKAGKIVMTEAIPYCFMSGYEKYVAERIIPDTKIFDFGKIDEDFTKTRQKEGKKKGPECEKCKFFGVCEGTWREYPEKFGWSEFIPVEKSDKRNIFFERAVKTAEYLAGQNGLKKKMPAVRKILKIISKGIKEIEDNAKIEFSFSTSKKKGKSMRFFIPLRHLCKAGEAKGKIKEISSLFRIKNRDILNNFLQLKCFNSGKIVITFGLEWLENSPLPKIKIFFESPSLSRETIPADSISEIERLSGLRIKNSAATRAQVFGIDFSAGEAQFKIYYRLKDISKKTKLSFGSRFLFSKAASDFFDNLAGGRDNFFLFLQRFQRGRKLLPEEKIYKIYRHDNNKSRLSNNVGQAENEIDKFLEKNKNIKTWGKIKKFREFCQKDNLMAVPTGIGANEISGESNMDIYYCCYPLAGL